MEDQLWGEITSSASCETNLLTKNMLEMKVPKPYPLASDMQSNFGAMKPKLRAINKCPYIQHTIHLRKFISEGSRCIKTGRGGHQTIKSLEHWKRKENMKKSSSSDYGEKKVLKKGCEADEVSGCSSVDKKSVDRLTRLAVTQISLAHGYELAQESVVNLLMDVVQLYIKTLTRNLRNIVDHEALTGITGFYDGVDQLLHDNNIEGVQALCDFHKTNVIHNHTRLLQRAKLLGEKSQAHARSHTGSEATSSMTNEDFSSAMSWNLENYCNDEEEDEEADADEMPDADDEWKPTTSSNSSGGGGGRTQPQQYINTFRPIYSPSQDTNKSLADQQPDGGRKIPPHDVYDY